MRGEMIGIGAAIVILVDRVRRARGRGPSAARGASCRSSPPWAPPPSSGRAFDLSFFILNMITMMGLALGIDYSLVIVQRFREELAHGRTRDRRRRPRGQHRQPGRAVLGRHRADLARRAARRAFDHHGEPRLRRDDRRGLLGHLGPDPACPPCCDCSAERVNKGKLPISHPGAEPRVLVRRWLAASCAVPPWRPSRA